jgi:elongation factor P
MISTHEFKRGTRLELDGDPRVIVDMTTQTTAGRGSQTLVRCKLKNLKTGQLLDRTFSGGDRVKAPDFEIRPAEYLYTVNNALKLCRLETGLELKVPLFVEAGQRIVVDTREARYVRRA